jgi:hypothetical protein
LLGVGLVHEVLIVTIFMCKSFGIWCTWVRCFHCSLQFMLVFCVGFIEDIYFRLLVVFSIDAFRMCKFGGPQALPGGAQPDPHPLYGGKGLSLGK